MAIQPVFVVPAGVGHRHQVFFRRHILRHRPVVAGDTKIRGRIRQGIVQHPGKKLAPAFDGQLIQGDVIAVAVGPVGGILPDGDPVRPVLGTPGQCRYQGAFEVGLGIDNGVVALLTKPTPEIRQFATSQCSPEIIPPAPVGGFDHPADEGVPPGDLGERLIHYPVEEHVGPGAGDIRHRGQGLDQITHGGELDDKDVHSVSAGRGSCQEKSFLILALRRWKN